MSEQTFERIERKYIINKEQKVALENYILPYMNYDSFCQNGNNYCVQNIYFDTENNSLISNSISKPSYKIKFRVRHYVGTNFYFLEGKQKTLNVVSKRRIALTQEEFNDFMKERKLPIKNDYLEKQIVEEFKYFLKCFPLNPRLYLSYNRVAMFNKDDSELRITFDNHIRGSRNNFLWDQPMPEIDILDNDKYILEIKYNRNFPLWLSKILDELKIFHSSFSKYGEEYKSLLKGEH